MVETVFSVQALLLHGRLGRAEVGMQRAAVLAALGAPDDWMADDKQPGAAAALIWRYGLFEVHFVADLAVSFFTDYVDDLDAGDGRTVEPWILAPSEPLTLGILRQRLQQSQVHYSVHQNSQRLPVLRIKNGADLLFDSRARPGQAPPAVTDRNSASQAIRSPDPDAFLCSALCATAPSFTTNLAPWPQ